MTSPPARVVSSYPANLTSLGCARCADTAALRAEVAILRDELDAAERREARQAATILRLRDQVPAAPRQAAPWYVTPLACVAALWDRLRHADRTPLLAALVAGGGLLGAWLRGW